MKAGLNKQDLVKVMMGRVLQQVNVLELLKKYNAVEELDFLLSPECEYVDALQRLEDQPPEQKEGETPISWQVAMIRQQAAALCFLTDCGQPGTGVRKKVFPNEKGRLFREVVRMAGHQLWIASGEKEGEEPIIAPIVLKDDKEGDTGLYIGRRFYHVDGGAEEGIDGFTPELPIETLVEQRMLARAGLRKAEGKPDAKKMILGLAVAPAEDWEECIRRLDRLIKERSS